MKFKQSKRVLFLAPPHSEQKPTLAAKVEPKLGPPAEIPSAIVRF